jgi:hypothetical protein
MYVPYLIGFSDAARGLVRVAAITATNAFGVIVFICIRGIRGTRHFRNGNRLFNIEGSVVPNAVAGLKYAGKGHNRRKVIQIKKPCDLCATMCGFCTPLARLKNDGI